MRNIVTMKDIADELNVTVMSVSKALSGKEGIGDELRSRIIKKAEELGYKKNLLPNEDENTRNIGILVAERRINSNAIYMSLQQPLIASLTQLNYYGITEIISDETEHLQLMPKILKEKKVVAFIILGQMEKEYISLLKTAGIPYLYLAHLYDDETNGIVDDNLYAGCTLGNYLIDKGFRSIGFVGNIHFSQIALDRYLGVIKAGLTRGLKPADTPCINDVNEFGEEIPLILPNKLPECFICNECRTAYKLIHQLEGLEYSVPGDISVAAFDDGIFADVGIPRLTTYSVNCENMARLAAESIIIKLENPKYHIGRKIVHGSVIIRDSVNRKKSEKND